MNAVSALAKYLVVWCVFIAFCCNLNLAEELTFELPDNEKMCFHEIIEENTKCVLEYQVGAVRFFRNSKIYETMPISVNLGVHPKGHMFHDFFS